MLRQRPTRPGIEALYQHQAILSVARSWLTRKSEEGMVASGSRMIVPCDLDILPLLALVANDYSEIASFREGSGPEAPPGPIMVYQDEGVEEQSERLVATFLQPRWFDTRQRFVRLPTLIKQLRPSTCVLIGDATNQLLAATSDGYRFERVIGFAAFERQERLRTFFSSSDEDRGVIMADSVYSARLESNQREERRSNDYRSFWDMTNSRELPDRRLEQFVPWGPAFEMNAFTGRG